ncbi:hypothetical protein [Streptomyces sp. NBC_00443]|uniref:hypothetical protein n=1 Tax=Streptomyces sp. NBC_00443 TaxID=2975743 RepID=UPI002E1A8C56
MDEFELPEDLNAFASYDDDALAAALEGATAAFKAKMGAQSVTGKDMDTIRSLSAAVKKIKEVQAERVAAAEAAAAEIDALAADVLGLEPTDDTTPAAEGAEGGTEFAADTEQPPAEEPAAAPAEQPVTAAVAPVRRR